MPGSPIIERLRAEAKRLGWAVIIDGECRRFRSADLAGALALWRGKVGAEGIPSRRDFTPRVMQAFLDKVALFERIEYPDGNRHYRARLTGEKFANAMAEMSGQMIDKVVPVEYLPRWYLLIDTVLAYRAPLRVLGRAQAFNRDYLVAEHFLAPLLDERGEVTQMLVVANHEGDLSWPAVEAEEAALLGRGGN